MELKNERILPTKNKRIFEAISLLSTATAVGLIAQKQPEGWFIFSENKYDLTFQKYAVIK